MIVGLGRKVGLAGFGLLVGVAVGMVAERAGWWKPGDGGQTPAAGYRVRVLNEKGMAVWDAEGSPSPPEYRPATKSVLAYRPDGTVDDVKGGVMVVCTPMTGRLGPPLFHYNPPQE